MKKMNMKKSDDNIDVNNIMRDNIISSNTKRSYTRDLLQLLRWVQTNEIDWLTEYGNEQLSWNLACRCNNTARIKLADVRWSESFDAFSIMFSTTKTDQLGDASKYPRHIYANPFAPLICSVLALGVYLTSCFSQNAIPVDNFLFPGVSQDARFANILQRTVDEHWVLISRQGYQRGEIGTHSIRKGVVLYFASSPPVFENENNEWVDAARCGQFKGIALVNGLEKLTQMCLGSILYHYDWLQEFLEANHIFLTASMVHRRRLPVYNDAVILRYPWNDNENHYSGIPPASAILQKMEALYHQQVGLGDDMEVRVRRVIHDEGVAAGHVTPHNTRAMIDELREELRADLRQELRADQQRNNASQEDMMPVVLNRAEIDIA
jgi:hypothetical protein